MLDFQPELTGANGGLDEELETANLQKNELYDLVANVYLIPPYCSTL